MSDNQHYMIFVPRVAEAIGCTVGEQGIADVLGETPDATFRPTTPYDCGHAPSKNRTTANSDADRDARFVAAYLNLRKVHGTCMADRTKFCAFADELHGQYELIYGRPCEPEPGVKPDSQTYEEWQLEREGGES